MAKNNNICCDNFDKAMESGTDNEGWGRLIRPLDDGTFKIGSDLPDIAYCPWCGKSLVEQVPTVPVDDKATCWWTLRKRVEFATFWLNLKINKTYRWEGDPEAAIKFKTRAEAEDEIMCLGASGIGVEVCEVAKVTSPPGRGDEFWARILD